MMPMEKPSLLITEDERIVAVDLQGRLESLGYDVAGLAVSGEEALAKARALRPALVLMDILLEGTMDGIETARRIREELDLPIIYLTANADPATLQRAEATHPFNYLLKPVRDRELRMSIEMALHHHAMARQLRLACDELERRVAERTVELVASNAALKNEIEEHRGTVRELRAAQEAAQAASVAKSQFLANITHELRTPMNGILGMVDLLLSSDLECQLHQDLEIVKTSATALMSIINVLLDFSRMEAGRMKLESTSFVLREYLQAVMDPLEERARARALAFHCTVGSDVPEFIHADALRFGQVLGSLVDNAIRFTEQGRIDVAFDVAARVGRRVSLHFAVRDTGIGVSPGKHRAIFEPFTQADGSDRRRYGGAGLGLSMATQLAELMGGSIWVESTSGAGSTFHGTIWCEAIDSPTQGPATGRTLALAVIPGERLCGSFAPANT
jgi:two-component system, sensor histidine kinase